MPPRRGSGHGLFILDLQYGLLPRTQFTIAIVPSTSPLDARDLASGFGTKECVFHLNGVLLGQFFLLGPSRNRNREPDHACPHHNGHYRSGQTLRLRRHQTTRPGRIGGRRAGNVRNRFIHLGGQAFDVGLFYERFLVAGYMFHPEMLRYLSYSPKRRGRFLLREQVDT